MSQKVMKPINIVWCLFLLPLVGCEGDMGESGPPGLNSLVNIENEPPNTNCENGGLKVSTGIDANANGILEDDEVLHTNFVCNDVGSTLNNIRTEPIGINCENGGLKIESGVDIDNSGVLDEDEIAATTYVCNGLNGELSLVNVSDEITGENCNNGGIKIVSGIDMNRSGVLDPEEVQIERYVCNGLNGGFDEQIRLVNTTSNYFYDFTNARVIDGGTVTTNSTEEVNLQSGNILNSFQDSEIELGIWGISSSESGTINGTLLILYRKSKSD